MGVRDRDVDGGGECRIRARLSRRSGADDARLAVDRLRRAVPSSTVSQRLEQLKARAETKAGGEVTWEQPRYPPHEGSLLVALGGWSLVAFLVLALVVGMVTIVRSVLGWIF